MSTQESIDRGKQGEGLDVRSVMEELKGGAMAIHTRSYRQMIRNGIAHGGITFLQNKIRYTDKRGNEETHSAGFIVRLCDDLVDTCNGLAVALKVFFVGAGDQGYDVPRQLLFEELQEETRLPWWKIIGCVDSEVGGKSQLIIYANPNSRHYSKVQWSAIQSESWLSTSLLDTASISSLSSLQRPGEDGLLSTEPSCETCGNPAPAISLNIAA